MIPLESQRALREEFFPRVLEGRVRIDFFTRHTSALFVLGREPCVTCDDALQLIEEIAAASPLLTLTVHEQGRDRELEQRFGIEQVPATVIRGVLNRPLVFYGLAGPLLFGALINAIGYLSRSKADLSAAALKRLKRLHDRVQLRLLVADEAEYSTTAVLTACAFVIASSHVRADVAVVTEFPRLVERYNVRQVPFTIINERVAFPGLVSPDDLAEEIFHAVISRTLSSRLPPSLGAVALRVEDPNAQPAETVRPSGLYIPGR